MPEVDALAKHLKCYRAMLEKTQFEMSSEIGISEEELSLLERGQTDPKLSTMQKMRPIWVSQSPSCWIRRTGKQMDDTVLQIYDLLYRLGVTARYVGFFHITYAVRLCAEQPERLQFVTKWVYPDVAKQYNTNWQAVARNIATVAAVAWAKNRPLLEELARCPLTDKPTNAQLLAILAANISPPAPDRARE